MRSYHICISLVTGCNVPATPSSASAPSTHAAPTFVPSSIFQPLPSHKPAPAGRRYTVAGKTSNYDAQLEDYRIGQIRIDWVDFTPVSMNVVGSKKVGVGKEKAADARRREPVIATFNSSPSFSTKEGSTNLPEGIVHIYRDLTTTADPKALAADEESSLSASTAASDGQGLILAVLAVPAWMTPSDFLAFVSPASDGISLLRMIRDSAPNRSIVLLKFRTTALASEFAEVYNGKAFNSMEPETCHVVRVLSVSIETLDSFSDALLREGARRVPDAVYELPTCPVCLERMDSAVTGLITVPCSHTFHCACLSKWGDSRCPVCRYSQTLLSSHPPTNATSSIPIPFARSLPDARCVECDSSTNLWICLICGHIGCGRYGRAHAHGHYVQTTHLYALELETQRVWDYAGDGYVHRLIQNKADGKLVELPSAASTVGPQGSRGDHRGPSLEDALGAEKIEAIGIEYSYLLTSQLDSQRAFYEEQITDLRAQMNHLTSTVKEMSQNYEEEKKHMQTTMTVQREQEEQRVSMLHSELAKMQGKAEKRAELVTQFAKELKEERAVSKGLLENLESARRAVQQLTQEKLAQSKRVQELEEQVRDIMFTLEARDRIKDGQGLLAEAAGGSIGMTDQKTRAPKSGKTVRK